LFLDEQSPYYLLLNQSSIDERTAVFIASLNLIILNKIRLNKEILEKKDRFKPRM
jgi:hypothetical protein